MKIPQCDDRLPSMLAREESILCNPLAYNSASGFNDTVKLPAFRHHMGEKKDPPERVSPEDFQSY